MFGEIICILFLTGGLFSLCQALGLFLCVCKVLYHLACFLPTSSISCWARWAGVEIPSITLVDFTVYSFSSISSILCILRLCCWVFIKLVLYLAEFILLSCVISVFDLSLLYQILILQPLFLSVFTWHIFLFVYFQCHCNIELEFLPNSM